MRSRHRSCTGVGGMGAVERASPLDGGIGSYLESCALSPYERMSGLASGRYVVSFSGRKLTRPAWAVYHRGYRINRRKYGGAYLLDDPSPCVISRLLRAGIHPFR